MGDVKNFIERSKEFEEAHYSCRELLQSQIQRIENYISKWIFLSIVGMLLIQISGFTYMYFEFIQLRKKVDHRYFLMKESLEDIHKVRLDNGKIVSDYVKD